MQVVVHAPLAPTMTMRSQVLRYRSHQTLANTCPSFPAIRALRKLMPSALSMNWSSTAPDEGPHRTMCAASTQRASDIANSRNLHGLTKTRPDQDYVKRLEH